MKFVYTDGQNSDFILLCGMLDDYLNKAVGGEKQRKQYIQYNTLENIHDVILIYENGLPIACAAFKRYDADTAEVKRVFLRKEYRGGGISGQLLAALEARAKEQSYSSLILETGRLLAPAMGFYRKTGFEVIDNYGQYRDMPESVCMRKSI